MAALVVALPWIIIDLHILTMINGHGFPTEFTLWCRNLRNTGADGSTVRRR